RRLEDSRIHQSHHQRGQCNAANHDRVRWDSLSKSKEKLEREQNEDDTEKHRPEGKSAFSDAGRLGSALNSCVEVNPRQNLLLGFIEKIDREATFSAGAPESVKPRLPSVGKHQR